MESKPFMGKEIDTRKNVRGMLVTFLVVVSLFFAVKTIQELKNFDSPDMNQNMISVSGYGEVATIADTANISFSVTENAKTVAEAQTQATTKINTIISYLKSQNIDDKDIKTDSYNIYPQYENTQQACTPGVYCPPGKQVISGYEVTQSTTVKVRDTSKAGDILTALGDKGASNISNLSFTVDAQRQQELQLQAQQEAIADARANAEKIAQSLGVRLVRVTGMYENGGGYPVYSAKSAAMGTDAMMAVPTVAPQLPQGENKVTSNMSVTYEIK